MEGYPKFPKGFKFGAATAAYQVEGAWNADGKGESIWDRFTHKRGKINNRENGDIACDHYNRYRDDIALMGKIGLNAYRFSVSWPRILPEGTGRVNKKGCDFYEALVDELLARNIEPFLTLYHWDLPQVLQDRGGWANRDSASWFGDYACKVFNLLGDRVKHWITLNEPFEFSAAGHLLGIHAPGNRNIFKYFRVIHNVLRAHGIAARTIKDAEPSASVGISLNLRPIYPKTESTRDKKAVHYADMAARRIILDPLFKGKYPAEYIRMNRFWAPKIINDDMDIIMAPLDFLGVNNYSRDIVRYAWWAVGTRFWTDMVHFPETEYIKNGVQYTSMGWEVYSDSLYEVLMFLKNEYGNPVTYITENGAAFSDVPVDTPEGVRVHDIKRIDYFKKYLSSLERAINEGADCRGYFAWSFLDNFEWHLGYSKRFGIVYVDYRTQERIIKDSGCWYADLVAAQK